MSAISENRGLSTGLGGCATTPASLNYFAEKQPDFGFFQKKHENLFMFGQTKRQLFSLLFVDRRD